jgi:Lipocalin-like domain
MRVVLVAALAAVGRGDRVAVQPSDGLVGTWRLVSASATTAAGTVEHGPYGPKPSGLLIYTSAGTMSAQVSYGGRSRLSADRVAAPAAERAEAFATFFAYGGRYTMTGDRVVHHVDIASVENWVGTDLIRVIARDGDRMTLRTPPLAVGGVTRTSELLWRRVH